MSDVLTVAMRLQREAAALGFDWRERQELWEKLAEETEELKVAATQSRAAATDELGDLLFMAVNLARHLGIDPAEALRSTNDKFSRRFAQVTKNLENLPPIGDPRRLDEMEARWQQAKRAEKKTAG
jgi:uncharacterized protein YabN with tetrapyrrole methylase and pyrophosphatase domain